MSQDAAHEKYHHHSNVTTISFEIEERPISHKVCVVAWHPPRTDTSPTTASWCLPSPRLTHCFLTLVQRNATPLAKGLKQIPTPHQIAGNVRILKTPPSTVDPGCAAITRLVLRG